MLADEGFVSCFRATPEDVRRALDQVEQFLGQTEHACAEAMIVLAEALNNVVEHAYAEKPDGLISLFAWLAGPAVSFELRDKGRPMPKGDLPVGDLPDHSTTLEHLPEGGFGWFLIHDLTEALEYERVAQENILRFRVPLTSGAQVSYG